MRYGRVVMYHGVGEERLLRREGGGGGGGGAVSEQTMVWEAAVLECSASR